jgi:hypothetical protein
MRGTLRICTALLCLAMLLGFAGGPAAAVGGATHAEGGGSLPPLPIPTDVCVSPGLPDQLPAIGFDHCGPDVILLVETPVGTKTIDLGPCHTGCSAVIVIPVSLAPCWPTNVHVLPQIVKEKGGDWIVETATGSIKVLGVDEVLKTYGGPDPECLLPR